MLPIKIFLDAETLPPAMTDEQLEDFKSKLKCPKTLKDPVKIEKWYEDNRDKKYRDLAKTSSTAHIATLAYAFNDKEIDCVYDEDRNEKLLLETFYNDIRNEIDSQLGEGSVDEANYTIKWIGYNLRKFDLDLIWKRSKYHGLNELASLIPRDRFSKDVIDIMEIFQGPNFHDYVSQDTVCKYFNIEGKPGDIDGSKVYDFWMDGKYDEVALYNMDDVKKVRALYKVMVGN